MYWCSSFIVFEKFRTGLERGLVRTCGLDMLHVCAGLCSRNKGVAQRSELKRQGCRITSLSSQ